MFQSWFDSSSADLYMDLGTANTLVSMRGKGLVINEPSIVAFNDLGGGKKKIVAVGLEAREKLAKAPGNLSYGRPFREGVVADLETTEAVIRYFLSRPGIRSSFSRPRVLMSLPHGVTDVERQALKEAGKAAGAKSVFLIDEPMAAAVGVGLPVRNAKGCMLVDIGGGTTAVAVIALADIVYSTVIHIGGQKMDEGIMNFVRDKKSLIITEFVAEQLKIAAGTARPAKDLKKISAQGRDASTGLNKPFEITSEEIGKAMDESIQKIIDAIHSTIEETPPELVSDIIESGLVLAGGGALIRAMDQRISEAVKLPVKIAKDPLTAIAAGGQFILEDKELFEKVLVEEEKTEYE